MKFFVTVFVVLGVVIALNAADIPLDPHSCIPFSSSHTYSPATENLLDMRVALPTGMENQPFYYSLEMLTQQERENAKIEIIFMQPVSREVDDFSNQIVQIWNSNRFDEALVLFSELDLMTGVKGNALIGISWRTPIPAPVSDWGDDVLISARDSVFVLAMDHNTNDHHLFAVIGFTGDGSGSKYTMNFSNDGGASWSETYALGGFTYVMNDLDGCVVSNHFYVAYSGGSATNPSSMAWLKRFRSSDGAPVDMPNGSSTFNIFNTTEIVDIDISSNHEQTNNRLYFYCIDNTGVIHNYYNNPTNVTWTPITTNINDAQQGLDTDWNLNFTDHSSILSYIDNANQVKIYGRDNTSWDLLITYSILGTSSYFTTGIGGYGDTLFCAFNYDGAHMQVRYLVNYAGSWAYGFLAPDTMESNFSPDVTLRNGSGIHAVYRGPGTPTGYYRYRGYTGSWSTPEKFNDHTMTGNIRPQIEYVGSGDYGILYRRPMGSHPGNCYFDRSNWTTGVEENISTDINSPINVRLSPNPSISDVQISFTVKTSGNVTISLFDQSGRLVNNILNETKTTGLHTLTISKEDLLPGIYFVRVETPDNIETKPLTIIK